MIAQKIVRPWFGRPLIFVSAVCLIIATAGIASAAGPNQEAINQVMRLNREARQFYDAMEFGLAEKNLLKAVEIGDAAALGAHVVVVGTHGNLGVLYATGIKDDAKAVMHFKKALELRSEYVPNKELSSPEVKELFQQARSELQSSGPAAPGLPEAASDGQLQCPVAEVAKAGKPLRVRCVADAASAATGVTVYFRSGASSSFRSLKMTSEAALDGSPSWTIQIPGEGISGDQLSLYFEAHSKSGDVVAEVGSSDAPNQVGIRSGGGSGSSSRQGEYEDDSEGEGEGKSKEGGSWWFGLGMGTGYGYAKGDGPEAYPKYVQDFQAGAAWAKEFHYVPAVGYFITPKLSLSLEGRLQTMAQWSSRTAKGAIAFLLRLVYFTDGKTLRFYGGAVVGGGEGFRLTVVDLPTKEDRPASVKDKVTDTVRGGPVILGATGGMAINLSQSWSWIIETNALIGFPMVSMVMDFNTGIRFKI